jgi:chromate transport protein ChrA
MSFAVIGSDFHGFTFDLLAILGVATPFFIALAGGIFALRLWQNPLSIVNGFFLALISSVGGLLLRHYVWSEGTPQTFILVTGAYFLAFMIGWRLIARFGVWAVGRSRSVDAAT